MEHVYFESYLMVHWESLPIGGFQWSWKYNRVVLHLSLTMQQERDLKRGIVNVHFIDIHVED